MKPNSPEAVARQFKRTQTGGILKPHHYALLLRIRDAPDGYYQPTKYDLPGLRRLSHRTYNFVRYEHPFGWTLSATGNHLLTVPEIALHNAHHRSWQGHYGEVHLRYNWRRNRPMIGVYCMDRYQLVEFDDLDRVEEIIAHLQLLVYLVREKEDLG